MACVCRQGSAGNACLVKSDKQSEQVFWGSCSDLISPLSNAQITSPRTCRAERARLSLAQEGTWFYAILAVQAVLNSPPTPHPLLLFLLFQLLLPFSLHKYSALARNQLLVLNKETQHLWDFLIRRTDLPRRLDACRFLCTHTVAHILAKT